MRRKSKRVAGRMGGYQTSFREVVPTLNQRPENKPQNRALESGPRDVPMYQGKSEPGRKTK